MIPELGKHALPVLSAYGLTLLILGLLLFVTLAKGRRAKTRLEELETQIKKKARDD